MVASETPSQKIHLFFGTVVYISSVAQGMELIGGSDVEACLEKIEPYKRLLKEPESTDAADRKLMTQLEKELSDNFLHV